MHWIFLSPHFDDAALSCGGLIWELTHGGAQVDVWTICAGRPTGEQLSAFAHTLHQRWGITSQETAQAVDLRRAEDSASCSVLGASYRYFSIPDCIYRMKKDGSGPICDSEESLSTCFCPDDEDLACSLAEELTANARKGAVVAAPLTLGKHVDHCLTRRAAELSGLALQYYADYPYILKDRRFSGQTAPPNWKRIEYKVSEQGLKAWTDSIALHTSQLSTFWNGIEDMQRAIRDYCESMGGLWLWEKETVHTY